VVRSIKKKPAGRGIGRALPVLRKLYTQHPGADTELDYENPYQLLVATILSAQSTDAGVNRATPALFARYPNAAALAKASSVELEPLIHSTGFYRSKARSLIGMAAALVAHHQGEVPNTMEALVELPGVGRKTANVVLNVAFEELTIAVDTHVFRVSNRTRLAPGKDPLEVETKLLKVTPKKYLKNAHHYLILHGRYTCIAQKPLCWKCPIFEQCEFPERTKFAKLAPEPVKKVLPKAR